jgi:C-terminal processing protease CtpA/Prc
MKHFFTFIFIFYLSHLSFGQNTSQNSLFNFDIENIENGKPIGWSSFGNEKYLIEIDSTIVHGGKNSLSITNTSDLIDYRAWSFSLPNNYYGKKIKLSGYLKTENVSDGFASLWMRIDPSIAFDNMAERNLKGTNDWQKFEITLNMEPDNTEQIVFGGLLIGKGKVWIDDLEIVIDNSKVQDLKPYERNKYPADLDKEFVSTSKIKDFTPNDFQIQNLKTLGLVWGFLKYYHPEITKGNYNWDFELFRITPKILAATTSTERDIVLLDWIKKLGEVKEGKPEKLNPQEIKIVPDLDWLNKSGFSTELQNHLLNTKNANRSNKHYYIDFNPKVGNPKFQNESSYSKISFLDTGYRLLALFRYWNMIQYFFPNRELIGEDWKNVLEEFIPKIVIAKDKTEYTVSMLELIARIHDTHANIWGDNKVLNAYWGKNYPAFETNFIEEQAVVTDFYDDELAKKSNIQIGDVIMKINDKEVSDIVKERIKFYPASNYPTKLRDIGPELLRSNDSIQNITYKRNNQIYTQKIKLFPTSIVNIYKKYDRIDTSFYFIDKDIAYINNGSIKRKELPEIFKKIQNAKALIIDDRNYPSEFVLFVLSKHLQPKSSPFVKFSKGSIKTPGLFVYTDYTKSGINNSDYFKGKVIILVNETTQSSAEYHAMAYRTAPNATVIGSTTAGADGNVSSIRLPGGISTMISGIGVYYPDGRETQRIGIVPDIEVKPTIEGIKNGKDEVLEKAIEFIRKN